MANINTYVTLTLNVAHCKFINNTSLLENTNDDANGGAIALLSLTEVYIGECIFLNNTSPWLGGAIYYDITDVFRCGQFDNNRTLSMLAVILLITQQHIIEVLWNLMDINTSLYTILLLLGTKPWKVEP